MQDVGDIFGTFRAILGIFGDPPPDRIPWQVRIYLYVTLQSDKKLKIFKKCITSLRFVDRILMVGIRFSATASTLNFNIPKFNFYTVGTSWIPEYLKSDRHRGNRLARS
jgi:hypothetical protein